MRAKSLSFSVLSAGVGSVANRALLVEPSSTAGRATALPSVPPMGTLEDSRTPRPVGGARSRLGPSQVTAVQAGTRDLTYDRHDDSSLHPPRVARDASVIRPREIAIPALEMRKECRETGCGVCLCNRGTRLSLETHRPSARSQRGLRLGQEQRPGQRTKRCWHGGRATTGTR